MAACLHAETGLSRRLPVTAVSGDSEDDAVEVRRVGEPPSFSFEPRDHLDLAAGRGWIDLERAAKVSGARFAYRVGEGALLELALYRFALDRLVAKGFVPVLPPVLLALGLTMTSATEVVIYALACMALNILVGHTGLVSFGHGAWFGLAAYAAALLQRNWMHDSFFGPTVAGVVIVAAVAAASIAAWVMFS